VKRAWKEKTKAWKRWCHQQLLYVLAYCWRRVLFRTTFIAITGSVGKTTCKECLAAILAARFPTARTLNNQNEFHGVPRTILRVRPWHRYAVVEVATDRPGMIAKSARLLRPAIAIVLGVAGTHTRVFPTLDDTAAEKARLLEALAPDGLAILNADDPRVARMAEGTRCRVKTFGQSAGTDLRADAVSSKWPARLGMRVSAGAETQLVDTSLVGEHWTNSVLASLLAATSCGIRLEAAARALAQVRPFMARMQPVSLPNGALILRDEANGSLETLNVALQVFEEAQASRRVLIVSGFTDAQMNSRSRLKELGKIAARTSGLAVFIGEHAGNAVKQAVASGMKPGCAVSFADVQSAARYLKTELRRGDFALLKGRGDDHLSRILFAQFGEIGCWKTDCRRLYVCDVCEDLRPAFDLKAELERSEAYLYGSAASLSPSPKKLNASTTTKTGTTGSISQG
jgi:UDP-N-acetylmuramoyl-tripeptide--D-alanyl-D-alanine ligase